METLKTAIEFVSNGAGGQGTAQTGDPLLITCVIAMFLCIAGLAFALIQRQRTYAHNYAGRHSIQDEPTNNRWSIMTIVFAVLVALSLIGTVGSITANRAIADDSANKNVPEKIKAVVDDNTGAVTIEDGYIQNIGTDRLILKSVKVSKSESDGDCNYTLTLDGKEIFNDKADVTKTLDLPFAIESKLAVKASTDMTPEIAKSFVGKSPLTIEYEIAKDTPAKDEEKAQATEEINTIAEESITEVDSLNLSEEEKATFEDQIKTISNKTDETIANAKWASEIAEAKEQGKKEIQKVVDEAKAKSLDNTKSDTKASVDTASETASAAIEANPNLSNEEAKSFVEEIKAADSKAKEDIDNAKTEDEVKAIQSTFNTTLQGINDKAEQQAKDNLDKAKEDAVKAIDDILANAKGDVDELILPTSVKKDAKDKMENLTNEYHGKVDKAATIAEADQLVEGFNTAIDVISETYSKEQANYHKVTPPGKPAHGTVNIAGIEDNLGKKDESVTITYSPNEGESYALKSVSVTDEDGNQVEVEIEGNIASFKMPAKSVTITIEEAETFIVTVQTDGHGTASATPETAMKDTVVTLTATPSEGYVFDKWESSDVTIEEDNTFVMPAKAVTIKAIFREDKNPVITGTVTEGASNFVVGAEVSFGSFSAKTGAGGTFSLEVEYGTKDKVKISKDGFETYEGVETTINADTELGSISLTIKYPPLYLFGGFNNWDAEHADKLQHDGNGLYSFKFKPGSSRGGDFSDFKILDDQNITTAKEWGGHIDYDSEHKGSRLAVFGSDADTENINPPDAEGKDDIILYAKYIDNNTVYIGVNVEPDVPESFDTVFGTVTEQDSNGPVSDAKVTFGKYATTTNSDGSFYIRVEHNYSAKLNITHGGYCIYNGEPKTITEDTDLKIVSMKKTPVQIHAYGDFNKWDESSALKFTFDEATGLYHAYVNELGYEGEGFRLFKDSTSTCWGGDIEYNDQQQGHRLAIKGDAHVEKISYPVKKTQVKFDVYVKYIDDNNVYIGVNMVPTPPTPTETVNLSGTVTDSQANGAIAGANVKFDKWETTTDNTGKFNLEVNKNTTSKLTVTKSGFKNYESDEFTASEDKDMGTITVKEQPDIYCSGAFNVWGAFGSNVKLEYDNTNDYYYAQIEDAQPFGIPMGDEFKLYKNNGNEVTWNGKITYDAEGKGQRKAIVGPDSPDLPAVNYPYASPCSFDLYVKYIDDNNVYIGVNMIPSAEHQHEFETIYGQDATCTMTGYKSCVKCKTCGKYYRDTTGEASLIGDEAAYETWKNTAQEAGGGMIPKTAHQTHHEHAEPTCTENGYNREVCDNCGTIVSETIIEALGHNWEDIIDLAPTYTAIGSGHQQCTRCGAKGQSFDIDKLETTVNFDNAGGTGGQTQPIKARFQESIYAPYLTVATPSKEGYKFLGYYDSASENATKYFDEKGDVVKDKNNNPIKFNVFPDEGIATLYAHWEQAETITFYMDNYGDPGCPKGSFTANPVSTWGDWIAENPELELYIDEDGFIKCSNSQYDDALYYDEYENYVMSTDKIEKDYTYYW